MSESIARERNHQTIWWVIIPPVHQMILSEVQRNVLVNWPIGQLESDTMRTRIILMMRLILTGATSVLDALPMMQAQGESR